MDIIKIKLLDTHVSTTEEGDVSVIAITDVETHPLFDEYLSNKTREQIEKTKKLIAQDITRGKMNEIFKYLAVRIEEDIFKGW